MNNQASLPIRAIDVNEVSRRVSRWAAIKTIARQRPGMVIGFMILFSFVLIALLAPVIAPYDPLELIPRSLRKPPSAQFLFGTDNLGRDVFSRVVYGTQVSIIVGLVAVAIAMLFGTTLGVVAGFYGRWVDSTISRVTDIMLAFPGILLAIAVVAILGPSLTNAMIAVGISTIPVYTRTARGSVLKVKNNDYIEAAYCVGVPNRRIMLRHILPNIAAPLIVLSTVNVGTAILSAAGLSYLGLGAQPPTAEWGAMLSAARQYLRQSWWMATFPGLAIMLIVLAVNLFGDGLREILDPAMKNK